MTTMTWEPGTCVHTPAGEIGIVVVTSYRSHLYSHPGDPCINTVDVLIGNTGQVLTYRADRLRPGVSPAGSGLRVPPRTQRARPLTGGEGAEFGAASLGDTRIDADSHAV